MKKGQFLTVLAMFTATGLMMAAMGFLSLPQDSSLSFSQAWQLLLNERPVFCGVVIFYFSVMFLCNAWVGIGLLLENYHPLKGTSRRMKIIGKKLTRIPARYSKTLIAKGHWTFQKSHS
jgi:hypothetical protein